MSVNKYRPHVILIPEDDANRQLAVGFLGHYAVADRVVEMRDPAGGWGRVLDIFESEYLNLLRANENAHVVMLIDFDEMGDDRKSQCNQRIPDDLKSRAFLIGSRETPEALKKELGMPSEKIGEALAQDCNSNELGRWHHPHLRHNLDELRRMTSVLKQIVFQG